jgi:hypothetical protein
LERKLKTGKTAKELSTAKTLTVYTKCPEKYLLVDLETGEKYLGNPSGSKLSWNKITEAEFRILKNLLDNNS